MWGLMHIQPNPQAPGRAEKAMVAAMSDDVIGSQLHILSVKLGLNT